MTTEADCGPFLSAHLHPVLPTNVTSGEHISVSCSDGYELQGSNVVTCFNGRWLPELPTCSDLKVTLPDESTSDFTIVMICLCVGLTLLFILLFGIYLVIQKSKAHEHVVSDQTLIEKHIKDMIRYQSNPRHQGSFTSTTPSVNLSVNPPSTTNPSIAGGISRASTLTVGHMG